jgi:uncharacterized protein (TIGR02145 family)
MLGNFEINRPNTSVPECAAQRCNLSGIQSAFFCIPSFTISKTLAATLSGWLDAIAAFEVFPIHNIIDVEDNSEEAVLAESRSNRRYQQRAGKYRLNCRVSVPAEFYDRFKQYEGQRLDVIFGDVNGNIIGVGDGDNIKPFVIDSIMVRKLSFGIYGQPCLVGITIDLAYPSQMRDAVTLPSDFYMSKAKFDELIIDNISEIPPDYTTIIYGFLYNWYATQDQGGGVSIIPASMSAVGWGVPSDADFTTLTDYAQAEITADRLPDVGIGNILKSRRQVDSPLGAPWATNEHPRWNEDTIEYGRDVVGFNAHAGGQRRENGYSDLGDFGIIWSNSEYDLNSSLCIELGWRYNNFSNYEDFKFIGFSIRPVRPATTPEQLLADGTACDPYIGNDGKVYRTVKIGTQVWVADNLAETKWSDGTWIAGYDGGTYTPITDAAWAALTTAALCAYDDDLANV